MRCENIVQNVYSYYENGEKVCTGTIVEIGKITNKTTIYLHSLKERPTGKRRLLYEGVRVPIYELYDHEGVVQFKGSAYECSDYMNIEYGSFLYIVNYTKNGKRKGDRGGLFARMIGSELR